MNFADKIKNFQVLKNNTENKTDSKIKEMEFISKDILLSGIEYTKESLLSDDNISLIDKAHLTSILDAFDNVINEIPSIKVTLNLSKDEEKQDD